MLKQEILGAGLTALQTGTPGREVDSQDTGVAFSFSVSAVGATPSLTYKWQGSLDNTIWKDIAYVTDASDTVSVAARVVTTVSDEVLFLANPQARIYRYYRVVVSANLNVTYGPVVLYVPD